MAITYKYYKPVYHERHGEEWFTANDDWSEAEIKELWEKYQIIYEPPFARPIKIAKDDKGNLYIAFGGSSTGDSIYFDTVQFWPDETIYYEDCLYEDDINVLKKILAKL